MKTITVVAWRRPNYLREVLDSIIAAKPAGWSLIVTLDEGFDSKCLDMAFNCTAEIPTSIIALKSRAGINFANRNAYEAALRMGSTLNLALEDDTPIAPDCLRMLEWLDVNAKPRAALLVNCFSQSKTGTPQSGDIRVVNTFSPWGWAFNRQAYEDIIRPAWMTSQRGWDISLNEHYQKHNLAAFEPLMSRVRNIGREGGVHFSPKLYDQLLADFIVSDGSQTDYKIV